ncbi:peptidase S15 [Cobetia amphilecti]|uniref:CocE/NonD family hydrolase n=1 Tax=Cobetia amphilecti TaxID=1055104 RepID=UPI000501C17E|nr:CocE/NonD family hydrolase [Cobetia amphilecti]KGA01893.1 peptidase S15 [Cobetia amphilecti]
MHVKTDFPHRVREIEHTLIPLSDGTQLAARIWLPEGAEQSPVPAILEYLPYRKSDGTAPRDALTHPYFAGHGYASVRVDMRGNGESDGLMEDEYLPLEQSDALEVIDWIANQSWCTGKLGMMGISWGGFNSLQLAAHRPEPLKVIITICSTDDRYTDDIHYKGGCLLNENLAWAATMLSFSAAPPDPRLVGDEWRAMWQQRLDEMPLLAETWLSHQHRDEYWKQGSINTDYADIEAAVYTIGGWGDAYKNTVGRMMENLSCPRKALIGPWIHKYPHFAVPNPAIGFLQEALRWWDHWLKGEENGVMDEPSATFYLQDSLPPKTMYAERPGRWVQTDGWPASDVEMHQMSLSESGLSDNARQGQQTLVQPVVVDSPLTAGRHQGEYCAIWFGPDLPGDQRLDDALAVCFDSEPLDAPLDILGKPKVTLTLASDQTCGQLTVRLSDVQPDGQVARITYGVLNLALRDHDTPQPLIPGEPINIELELDMAGYRIPTGHRLRVALASANFPMVWPAPTRAALTLQPGLQSLTLPVFTGVAVDTPFAAPESAPPANISEQRAARPSRSVVEDVANGEITTIVEDDMGAMTFEDTGMRVEHRCTERYTAHPEDADRTRAEIVWHYRAGRDQHGRDSALGETTPGQFDIRVESHYRMRCDAENFYLEAEQIAWEDDKEVHRRDWQRTVPRTSV